MNYLIVGASSGIGEACVKRLDQKESTLFIVARREEKLNEIKRECKGNVIVIPYDLKDIFHVNTIFKSINENKKKLDAMIYCAGMDGTWPVKTNNANMMQEMMNVNCFSFVEMAKNFYSVRNSNNGASIVAISSISSRLNDVGMSSYSASKAAMNSYVKTMAKEFLRRKIRVNAILPAGVATAMSESKEVLLNGISDLHCDNSIDGLGMIEPQNIAECVKFLISEQGKHITGELLTIGSGMSY